MDRISVNSIGELHNDDFSPLPKEVKKKSSFPFSIQPQQIKNKKKQKHVQFNHLHDKEQCDSPIKIVGVQFEDNLSRLSKPMSQKCDNKNRQVVLKSIDKFMQKAEKMQRQVIHSYHTRTTLNNSKKIQKSMYRNPQEFIYYFKQTMIQLRKFLGEISDFVEDVKQMMKQQVQKCFQQIYRQTSNNSKLQEAFENLHNLSGQIQKIPNDNDISMYTDKVGYGLLTHRQQQKKQQILGKIVKTRGRRMSSQFIRVNPQQQHKFEILNASVIESKGDYHKISLDDVNQVTSNMKKLIDML